VSQLDPVPRDAIQGGCRLLFGSVVHAADPEGSVGPQLAIIQAKEIGWKGDGNQVEELTGSPIE